jgi:hypothetical protein
VMAGGMRRGRVIAVGPLRSVGRDCAPRSRALGRSGQRHLPGVRDGAVGGDVRRGVRARIVSLSYLSMGQTKSLGSAG